MKEYAIFVACEEDKDPNFGGRYVLYTEEEVNTLGGLDAVLAKLKAEGEIIYAPSGRAYVKCFGKRIYLDECMRV